MNKRKRLKRLKQSKVSLYDVYKSPNNSVVKAFAIIASAYKSCDWKTKMCVILELERLHQFINTEEEN